MFNLIKNLFKSKYSCQHEFDNWEVYKTSIERSLAIIRIHQTRTCKKCGYTQLDVQEK